MEYGVHTDNAASYCFGRESNAILSLLGLVYACFVLISSLQPCLQSLHSLNFFNLFSPSSNTEYVFDELLTRNLQFHIGPYPVFT